MSESFFGGELECDSHDLYASASGMRAKGACGTTTDVVAFLRVRVIAAFQPEVSASEDISLERVEFVSTPVRY